MSLKPKMTQELTWQILKVQRLEKVEEEVNKFDSLTTEYLFL